MSRAPAGTYSRAVSPVSSRLSMSQSDIELHEMHFALPFAGTQSTDNLVPVNHPKEPKERDHEEKEDTASIERLIPNYKPIPLRWPFQALLVVLIFAVFAFFEYQVRKLPPVRYRALQPGLSYAGMSAGFPAVTSAFSTQVGETATATVPPAVKMSPSAVPKSTVSLTGPTPMDQVHGPTLTSGPRILVAAPRPPESAYPSPPASVTAYCGWKPPIWILYHRPGYQTLIGGRPTIIDLPALAEEIQMFTTTDPSWCPCTVLGGRNVWGGRWANDLDGAVWDTNDDGCKSAMNLISSFNSIKTVAFKTDMPALLSGPDSKNILPWDLPFQPFWGLPVTNANGDIAFPLEVRTKLFGERHDIFGNKLEGTGATATFLGEPCCSSTSGASSCASDIPMILPLFVPYTQPCDAGATVLETIWWTLPFGRPLGTTASSTASSTTPSSTTPTISSTARISSTESADLTVSISSTASRASTETSILSSRERSLTGSAASSVSTTSTMSTESMEITSSRLSASVPNTQSPPSDVNLSNQSTTTELFTAISSVTPIPIASSQSGKIGHLISIESTSAEFLTSKSISGTRETTVSSSSGKIAIPIVVDTTPTDARSSAPTTRSDTGTVGTWHTTMTEGNFAKSTQALSISSTVSSDVQNIASRTPLVSSGAHPVSEAKMGNAGELSPLTAIGGTNNNKQLGALGNEGATAVTSEKQRTVSDTTVFVLATPTPSREPRPPPPPGPISPDSYGAFFNLRSEADYLMASLVPVLIATLLKIPIQILTGSVNLALPFRALAKYKGGAQAQDSLFLSQRAISAPLVAIRFLTRARDPLALLNVILSTLSVTLVPLSTETIRLEYTSMYCSAAGDMCAYGLRNAGTPLRVAEAFLVIMAVLIIIIGIMLARWRTGFATEPWSIASMSSLLASSEPELRTLLRSIPSGGKYITDSQISDVLKANRFRLCYYTSPVLTHKRSGKPRPKYAIQVLPVIPVDNSPIRPTTRDPPERRSNTPKKRFWHVNPATRDISIRVTALIVHVGLLILILYYENTTMDTTFEAFMDSESFGVRLSLTTFGTAVSGFWDYYFFQISDTHIHTLLAARPRSARDSILLAPPSNPFIGLYRFIRSKDAFAFSIALTALLAKFTPILFANIPFRNTVTWKNHEACTWLAVAILTWMVIAREINDDSGNRKRAKNMPVGMDTIIGCMYYLVWSDRMLRDFEGLGTVQQRERDKLVSGMGRLYTMREFPCQDAFKFGKGPHQNKVNGVGIDYWVAEAPKSTRSRTSTGDGSNSDGC
ncbi:hypothetical protein QBC37DRAFT_285244 [Rhypophila decipiens]|uniref:Uncharacterized protein n=1 Tax=Rhypophila decipiens TaxID=261697 RepID=A0AAN6Y6Y8_9PEZI|nr:hypothetical protein QBC37DRAFT_285244 [Rhypophila decipiens]